jgi:hypothetical protein
MGNWKSFFQLWKFRVRGQDAVGSRFPVSDHKTRSPGTLRAGNGAWKSLECRGNEPEWQDASPSLAFYGHVIDLKHDHEALFKSFNGTVRRAIRKAVRTGLRVEFSNCFDSIRTFYALEGFIKNRIPDPLNDHKGRFLDLLFIIPSLLDERTSHKFRLSCWLSCKCQFRDW